MNKRFDENAIKMIIQAHISPINRVLKRGQVFNLDIPHLGQIKTHGNKKKNITKGIKKYQKKYHKKRNKKTDWTVEELLYGRNLTNK